MKKYFSSSFLFFLPILFILSVLFLSVLTCIPSAYAQGQGNAITGYFIVSGEPQDDQDNVKLENLENPGAAPQANATDADGAAEKDVADALFPFTGSAAADLEDKGDDGSNKGNDGPIGFIGSLWLKAVSFLSSFLGNIF